MDLPAFAIVLGFTAAAVLLGWGYFQHYHVMRPPIGVMTLGDVVVMVGTIVLAPFLDLVLPLWLVTGFLAVVVLSILSMLAEPVLSGRRALCLIALGLLGADVSTNLRFGSASPLFLLVNNTILVLAIVGATNLWAQSGLKARDTAVLSGALAVYDLIATSLLPVTSELFHRLVNMPLAPMIAWASGSTRPTIGLGDVMLATVFPLVMHKAFGQRAALVAIGLSLATIVALALTLELSNAQVAIPVMTVLGPLMILQYSYSRHRQGAERTMWQYHVAER